MKIRQSIKKIHGSIGLLMGLLFVISSLTGSAIVFYREIDSTVSHSLHHVKIGTNKISVDNILPPVQTKYPELSIDAIAFPRQSDRSYKVDVTDKNGNRIETFIDPYTGKVLGERVWEHSLIGFLYELHHDLLLGDTGLIIMTIVGIALLLMSISGMVLWTGWRNLKSGFKIRWQAPQKLKFFDLHQAIGITSQLFLATLALTGTIITVLHLPMFLPQPTIAKYLPIDRQQLPLSKLIQTANTAMPGGEVSSLYFESKESPKLIISKHFAEQETGIFDLSKVEIDRYTGKVLSTEKVIKPDGFLSVLVTIADLHFGKVLGLPSRIVYVLGGITPLVLLITGFKLFKQGKSIELRFLKVRVKN